MSLSKTDLEVVNWQKFEGLMVFAGATAAFYAISGTVLMYGLFILSFDLSWIGYAKDKKLGAITYNAVHNYGSALVFTLLMFAINQDFLTQLGVLWVAHVGMDRAFGYGLKKSSDFTHTHLGKVGKK